MEKITISSKEGKLNGLTWTIEKPKAHIVLFEGMEETSSRYNGFATRLNKDGYNVTCIDVFGQGSNVKKDLSNRGVWPKDGFGIYLEAMHEYITELKKRYPVYLFTHSMGSFMGQGYLIRYPNDVDKICLCGAGSKNPAVGIGLFLAKLTTKDSTRNDYAKLLNGIMFGGFNKKIKDPETDFDWLSYDKENIKKYIDDPLCGFGSNKGFVLEFLSFMKTLWTKEALAKVRKDEHILLITGEEDPVTNYSKGTYALEKMYKDIGVNDVSKVIYKNARHEILNESREIKDAVYKDVLEFFNK